MKCRIICTKHSCIFIIVMTCASALPFYQHLNDENVRPAFYHSLANFDNERLIQKRHNHKSQSSMVMLQLFLTITIMQQKNKQIHVSSIIDGLLRWMKHLLISVVSVFFVAAFLYQEFVFVYAYYSKEFYIQRNFKTGWSQNLQVFVKFFSGYFILFQCFYVTIHPDIFILFGKSRKQNQET